MQVAVLAAALGSAGAAVGQMSSSEHEAKRIEIQAKYRDARVRCAAERGNAREICEASVTAEERVALADLESAFSGTAAARERARLERIESAYSVSLQRCDDREVADRKRCHDEAAAVRERDTRNPLAPR